MTDTPVRHPHPKCRVNWQKPNRNWTICNYVDEVTNECKQTDWKRCPCGSIVRIPLFDGIPYKESERRAEVTHTSAPAPSTVVEDITFEGAAIVQAAKREAAKAARHPHPDDLFLITREELDRCCSQMSAAGYKVSANYIEALVLSRPHTSAPTPEQYCKYDSRVSPKHVCESCRGLRPKWCTFPSTSAPAQGDE